MEARLEASAKLSSGWGPSGARQRRRGRLLLGALTVLLLLTSVAYTQRDRYSAQLADLSRQLIGDENTARIEGWYFSAQDRVDRIKYDLFGGDTDPFGDDQAPAFTPAAPAPAGIDLLTGRDWPADWLPASQPVVVATAAPKPPPLVLPETRQLSATLADGEGVWTTAGLPHSSPDDPLMAKTFIRPDQDRPYALVGVLLLDKRRIRLHLVGGTEDPGGDRGVEGPGTIADADLASLLAAWNGGFKGPHGGFGMYADGLEYRPLRDGLASVVVKQDGTILMGEWGRDLGWSDDITAVRQNTVLLVDNCEVSPRTNEGNDTWGYIKVDSDEFITWRSAIGLTEDGDLLVAAGNSLSAASLAQALQAAGACTAMQLDINVSYVITALFFPQPDGSLGGVKFMDGMQPNPNRFLSTRARDFMYVTLDETNYKP